MKVTWSYTAFLRFLMNKALSGQHAMARRK